MKRKGLALIVLGIFFVLTLASLTSCGATVDVVYDTNGGAFSNGSPTLSLEKSSGTLLTEPVAPEKTGCIFVGWSTAAEGGELWNFATDRVMADTTLYAIWQTAEANVVAFVGGAISDSVIALSVGLDTAALNLSDIVTVSDYASWVISYDSDGSEVIESKILTDISVGVSTYYLTVTAKDGALSKTYTLNITKDNGITVTLDANEGVLSDTEARIVYGEHFTLAVPTREGYTFLGWKLVNSFVTDECGESLAESAITAPVTLVAEWEREVYTVTVNLNIPAAGSVTGGGEYHYGDDVNITVVTYRGYIFVGLFDGNGNIVSGAGVGMSFSATESKTLVATFELRAELLPFTFTSTAAECIITGLVDTSVNEISIPITVTEIEEGAFENATALTKITYAGTRAQWNSIVKTAADFSSVTVVCSDDPPPSSGGGQRPGGNVDNNGWTES